jgi:tryptophan-rich sensory protein
MKLDVKKAFGTVWVALFAVGLIASHFVSKEEREFVVAAMVLWFVSGFFIIAVYNKISVGRFFPVKLPDQFLQSGRPTFRLIAVAALLAACILYVIVRPFLHH